MSDKMKEAAEINRALVKNAPRNKTWKHTRCRMCDGLIVLDVMTGEYEAAHTNDCPVSRARSWLAWYDSKDGDA